MSTPNGPETTQPGPSAEPNLAQSLVSWLGQVLFTNWHFPAAKTREYSMRRREITARYGIYTTLITFTFLALIPLCKSPADRFLVRVFDKSRKGLLGWFNRFERPRRILRHFLYHYQTIKIVVFWLGVLAFLSFNATEYDLSYLGKRLGRVSTVCLTTVLFLTLRPSPLPDVLYLSLIPVHKWLSRLVILQGVAHTVVYVFYFRHSHTMEKLYKPENVYGAVALVGFLVILATSLSGIRRWSYRLFYINHYLWTWVIVVALHFHARPGIGVYTILNGSILLYQVLHRLTHTVRTPLEVTDISPNLVLVTLPSHALSQAASSPGSHIRIAEYKPQWFRRWALQVVPLYHPYTVASLPNDAKQRLVVRKTTFRLALEKMYLVNGSYAPMLAFLQPKLVVPSLPLYRTPTGVNEDAGVASLGRIPFLPPFDAPFNMNMKISAKRVLIVIGGSAISFALPLMRILTYNGTDCRLVWVIRDLNDAKILKYFPVLGDCIEVYVTGEYQAHRLGRSIARLQGGDEVTGAHLLFQEGALANYGAVDINKTPVYRDVEATDLGVEGTDLGMESEGEGGGLSTIPPSLSEDSEPIQLSPISVDAEAEEENVEVDFDEDEACGFDAMREVEGIEDGDTFGEVDFTALFSTGPTPSGFNARSKSMGNIGVFGRSPPGPSTLRSETVMLRPRGVPLSSTEHQQSRQKFAKMVKPKLEQQPDQKVDPTPDPKLDHISDLNHQNPNESFIRDSHSNPAHLVSTRPGFSGKRSPKLHAAGEPTGLTTAPEPSPWSAGLLKPGALRRAVEEQVDPQTVEPFSNRGSVVSFAPPPPASSAVRGHPATGGTASILRKASSATGLGQPFEFTTVPSAIKAHIPYGTKILHGRPKLGGYQYDWCVNNSCSGPVYLDDGDAVCCKDIKKGSIDAPTPLSARDDEEELKKGVWVIGAGPHGLVNNVQMWAKNNGFHFHEESFSV